MIELAISENEAGQRFDKYLKKRLPEATGGFLYKMLRKKQITLNGKKAAGDERLISGDKIVLFFSEETFRKFEGTAQDVAWKSDPRYVPPEILFEDTDLLVLNKPAGMLSQKANASDFSANEQVLRYLFERGALTDEMLRSFRPSVCNRLDRNTSGILLAGKTLRGAQEAAKMLRERTCEKYYHILVHGKVTEAFSAEAYLWKDERTNRSKVTDTPAAGASKIRSDFAPLENFRDTTLLSAKLVTGKPHQLRAQLAAFSFPILGDPKYGDRNRDKAFQIPLQRQMLHARELRFPDGRTLTAPYPPDFSAALEALREIG